MGTKKLHDWLDSQDFYELCQNYRHASDPGGRNGAESASQAFSRLIREIKAHALLLAAGDSDEIVRELRQWGPLSAVGRHEIPEIIERAASHILALKAELASVKAHAESSGDEVVRDLGRTHMMLNNAGQHIHSENCQRAASHILALKAELASVKAERDALKNLLAECETTLAHARVFIGTREKMHPDGQFLYDELLAQVRAQCAAHPKDAP